MLHIIVVSYELSIVIDEKKSVYGTIFIYILFLFLGICFFLYSFYILIYFQIVCYLLMERDVCSLNSFILIFTSIEE